MDQKQILLIVFSIGLFVLIYGFCDTKPLEVKQIEQSRVLNKQSTDVRVLLKEAKLSLDNQVLNEIEGLEIGLNSIQDDTSKVFMLKKLSSTWFKIKKPAISGHYAFRVAEIENTEDTWSIAATTFALGLRMEIAEKEKAYCAEKAISAFENAISINPDNLQHRVNLAVCLADYPPEENPMKGILQLLDLNEKHPNYVPALTALGDLGMKTGQLENAQKRLEKAYSLEPENTKVICMLAELYEKMGLEKEENIFSKHCVEKLNLKKIK